MTNQEREKRRDKVVQMYTIDGKSINEIAKNLNISWDSVKRDLVARNIPIISKRNQYSNGNGINDNLFAEINDNDSAYWLGFLYADGSVRQDRNEIALDLQAKDKKTIEDFHNFCGNKNNIREHNINRNGKIYQSYTSSFSNERVKNNLIKLGCVPKKSLILTFPTEEQVPQKFIYDFVRGYIDGDGYIQYDYSKHRYRIMIAGTKAFLQGLITRLDLFENTSNDKDNNSNIYMLTISHKDKVYKLLTQLYENSKYHLERKYEIYKQAKWAHNK